MPELVTVNEAQDYLGLGSSENTALVARLLGAAEDKLARLCDRFDTGGNHWLSAARVEYIDGHSAGRLLLSWRPVTAVASVSLVYAGGDEQALDLSRLTVDGYDLGGAFTGPSGVLGFRASGPSVMGWEHGDPVGARMAGPVPNFGGGFRRVKVAYTGGFVTVPNDLALAALETTAMLYRRKDRDPTLKSESLGDWSWTRDAEAELSAHVSDLIKPYRRTM
jgi:hypothetical protein